MGHNTSILRNCRISILGTSPVQTSGTSIKNFLLPYGRTMMIHPLEVLRFQSRPHLHKASPQVCSHDCLSLRYWLCSTQISSHDWAAFSARYFTIRNPRVEILRFIRAAQELKYEGILGVIAICMCMGNTMLCDRSTGSRNQTMQPLSLLGDIMTLTTGTNSRRERILFLVQ